VQELVAGMTEKDLVAGKTEKELVAGTEVQMLLVVGTTARLKTPVAGPTRPPCARTHRRPSEST
jgi:hypothetical protein